MPDDIILVLEPEHLLDFNLHRKSVRIPSRFSGDPVSFHRLVPADQVLQRATHDMMNTRFAVRRWRTLVERKDLLPVAQLYAAAKDIVSVPIGLNVLFKVSN
jgi:hypothetical protein